MCADGFEIGKISTGDWNQVSEWGSEARVGFSAKKECLRLNVVGSIHVDRFETKNPD